MARDAIGPHSRRKHWPPEGESESNRNTVGVDIECFATEDRVVAVVVAVDRALLVLPAVAVAVVAARADPAVMSHCHSPKCIAVEEQKGRHAVSDLNFGRQSWYTVSVSECKAMSSRR